ERMNWKTRRRRGGAISQEKMNQAVQDYGVELRGGGTDESPFVYRKLQEVLDAHEDTIDVLHVLKPVGVVMDGSSYERPLPLAAFQPLRVMVFFFMPSTTSR